MDNRKTGELIRTLRKERDMTQKELADRLHITDRAVSKWERGLCAPDIALLEPLARALGCTVLELIEGRRAEHTPEARDTALMVVDYSRQEVVQKVSAARKKLLGRLALLLALLLAVGGALLWRSGRLFVEDRVRAPDGGAVVTVYRKELSTGPQAFSRRNGVSLIEKAADGAETRIIYGGENERYDGLWWSPDSTKYVLSMVEETGSRRLILDWQEHNRSSNLNAYLSMGVEASELKKGGLEYGGGGDPAVDYQFLQWGRDSASMLICYSFADAGGQPRDGYFWYNCETGTVSAILELEE